MSNEFRADPGRPSYRGSSAALDPARCKAGVWSNERWSKYAQCARKAATDGWCKQHHPDAEAKREAEASARFDAETRRRMMGYYGERFMAALIKIRDGDNDPRATAAAALEGISYARAEITRLTSSIGA
jgi:hypothetical protein